MIAAVSGRQWLRNSPKYDVIRYPLSLACPGRSHPPFRHEED
jgi:hypothetical protein